MSTTSNHLDWVIPGSERFERFMYDEVIRDITDAANSDAPSDVVPIFTIEAFTYAVNHQLPIPPVLALWISVGFERYINAGGDMTLDQAFRTDPQKRGARSLIRSFSAMKRRLYLVVEMRQLKRHLGVSIEQAAEMVSRRIEDSDAPLTAKTLVRHYEDTGRWEGLDEPVDEPLEAGKVAMILSHYPKDSHPR